MYRSCLALLAVMTAGIACSNHDSDHVNVDSPGGTWHLQSAYYDGSLVELRVTRRGNPEVHFEFRTDETAQMKWTAGWASDATLVFWGSDTGQELQVRFDGEQWAKVPMDPAGCAALARSYATKFADEPGRYRPCDR